MFFDFLRGFIEFFVFIKYIKQNLSLNKYMANVKAGQKMSKQDKKKRRNSIIMGGLLIFLMTFGILGYGFTANSSGNPTEQYANFSYNGYEFRYATVNNNNIFVAIIGDLEFAFYNHPSLIENLSLSESFKEDSSVAQTIIFSAPTNTAENGLNQDYIYLDYLIRDLQVSSGKSIIRGALSSDLFNDYPVYNCDSANADQLVLVMKNQQDTGKAQGIYDTDTKYCYDFVASGLNVIKMRDRLLYYFIGVQD